MGSAHAPRQELAMMQASNLNSVSRFSIRRTSRQMQWRRRTRRSDSRGHAAGSVIVRSCVTGDAGVSDAPRRGRHARVSRDDGSAPCGTAARAEADGSVYLHCDPTARHYLSEDVRRGGEDRGHTREFIATRAASVLCARCGLKALRPVEAGHGGPRSTRRLRVDNRTIVSPALGLSGWRRWRRDPGESGALHCPDPARPRPWIKTSSVV
jgi:hypothetical protein